MALPVGTRLGPYDILSALGAGGFGEVYKARDTRLDRTVAIKILPSTDPEVRARFEREAKAIAALQHPHICTLYDVGHESLGPHAIDFLVMEYLDGETLADRLTRGPLKIDEALKTAIDIADALDAAHRAGFTHRDLKPANVMLTKSGATLLDFGLAKLRPAMPLNGFAMATTQDAQPVTSQGSLLGTLPYMAPEQVEGKEADARSDIFAFGAVVYEMLTGKRAFEGKSQASVIAAILEHEPPPLSTLQPLTPRMLDRVVQKCLAKDPERRWQTARDLRDELVWTAETGASSSSTAEAGAQAGGARRLAWGVAAGLLLVSLALAFPAMQHFRETASVAAPEARFEITTLPTTDPGSLAISPDGQRIVFVATAEGRPRLWLRSLDAVAARPLPGTDGVALPFWSPDSRSVGFFADSQLKRLDIDGGSVQTLASASTSFGGTWNRGGTILFATAGGLFRVAATGGEPVPVVLRDTGLELRTLPQFLPDGQHFLFYLFGAPEASGVWVGQLDRPDTQRLLAGDAPAVYASPGHLLVVRQGTLFAQPFDPARLALTGGPSSVAEHVATALAPPVSAAATGPIIYRVGSSSDRRQLAWIDRSGKEIEKVGSPVENGWRPALSPDGRRVALSPTINGNGDIWLLETARGVLTRFTFDKAIDLFPLWSPDGGSLVFASNRTGPLELYRKPATGPGDEELLRTTAQPVKSPVDWSPDGRLLLYRALAPTGDYDLWALPLQGDRTPYPVVQTPFDERDGQFSPDGKWIAYQSNRSGRFEIYVQRFPGPSGAVQVSTNGGVQVRWGRDGKELFYIARDHRLMATPIRFVSGGQAIEAGAPVPLFVTRVVAGDDIAGQQYSVSADGQRFLMNTVPEDASASPITVILNWKAKP